MKSNPYPAGVDGSPVPYELTDLGADPDSHLYPVASTYFDCCRSIGEHGSDCPVGTEGDLLAYISNGVVTLHIGDRALHLADTEAVALAEHLVALVGEVKP